MGTIIATNVKSLNGGCGTAKSVAALPHMPQPGYASDYSIRICCSNMNNRIISNNELKILPETVPPNVYTFS